VIKNPLCGWVQTENQNRPYVQCPYVIQRWICIRFVHCKNLSVSLPLLPSLSLVCINLKGPARREHRPSREKKIYVYGYKGKGHLLCTVMLASNSNICTCLKTQSQATRRQDMTGHLHRWRSVTVESRPSDPSRIEICSVCNAPSMEETNATCAMLRCSSNRSRRLGLACTSIVL